MALAFIDKLLHRKGEDVPYEDTRPPQTYVIALNSQRFRFYCHEYGLQPYSKNVHSILTETNVRGIRLRPKDKVVVTDDAVLNRDYEDIRRNILVASQGWVNISERRIAHT